MQSNSADLNGALNGYYVRIGGESGSTDAVEIYKQEGTTSTLVLRGIDGNAAVSPHLGIKVIRTNSAEWNLYVDVSGGTDYVLEGTAIDDAINGGAFLGVVCNYTSTRCQSFILMILLQDQFSQIMMRPFFKVCLLFHLNHWSYYLMKLLN